LPVLSDRSTIFGVPPILPRFQQWQQRIEDERRIGRILLEAGELPDGKARTVLRRSADGHHRDRRRGLPIVSKAVGGTSPGTDPLAALLAKENSGRRRS